MISVSMPMPDQYWKFPLVAWNEALTAGAIVLSVIYITSAVYQAFLHPLAKVPGPKLWAGSRLPLSWHFLKGDVWQAVSDLHLRYGPTVRIAPNELSTIVPQSWHDIYTSKPILPKDPSSQTPPLEGANSLFTAVGDEHRRLRGVFANSFSDKALRKQLPIIESYIGQLMARIGRDAKTSGGSLNIQKLYGYASFDIISELTSGEPQYSLEEGNEQSHIETFSVHAKYSTFRNVLVHFPPLDKILLSLLFSLSAKRRKENWNKGFERLTRRLQDPGPAVGSDIITSVVEKLNESKQRYITKTELLTNCLGFIIASSQLTTLVLTAMTYLLVQNPHTLTHLVMEIRNNFREERDITMASTSSLPYLEAVLKETLRIHHPTPIALPRVIPPEGRVIHGQMVPGKTIIGINLQVIQNCPDHWLEPRVFHSERFLPQEDPRYDTRFDSDNQVAFQPFSTGLRNCIGAKLFSVQAKLVLSRLLWNFDIGWAVKDPAWLNQKAWLGFEHKPLFLRITKRGQR